jgi:type IV pilus assembly protein PilM
MAKRVTTLFIGDTGISLLAMKGGQVDKWATLPLEPGLVSQGLIVDEVQVADKVKQIFKETGAKKKRVITALGGHDSLYRIITLPELPDAVLPEAIRREARRTIPTPLEEVYFSYQRLATVTKGETRLFLVTYPRNLVEALIRTLHKAGIKPYVMDLAPLALSRIPNEPRAIIVNAQLDHLDVMVVADRLPQVIRALSLPGEAESLEERLPLIAEEFNRTVAFYNSSHMERPLDTSVPVFVCGDLAESPDRWTSVVGGAGYPVSALSSAAEYTEGFDSNEFLVNIGLALKEVRAENEEASFSTVNFNVLPEAYVPPSFSIARVLIPVVTVVGIGLVVLAVVLLLIGRANIGAMRSQVTAAEAAVVQLQTETTTLRNQSNSAGAVSGELNNRITALEQAREDIYLDLREVTDLAKANSALTLGKVQHGGSSITVTGTATNVNAIYSYADALRDSPRFSSVWVGRVSGASDFQFTVTPE